MHLSPLCCTGKRGAPMQLVERRIVLPTRHQTIQLIPLGCVHADTEGFDRKLFADAIDRIEKDPMTWAIGCGDYFDLARTALRRTIRVYAKEQGDEGSQRIFDKDVAKRTADFHARYYRRIQSRLLGLAEGNHHWEFEDGTTDTQML